MPSRSHSASQNNSHQSSAISGRTPTENRKLMTQNRLNLRQRSIGATIKPWAEWR